MFNHIFYRIELPGNTANKMRQYRSQIPKLSPASKEYKKIADKFCSTIVEHRGNKGGVFSSYEIIEIHKMEHEPTVRDQYEEISRQLGTEYHYHVSEKMLFHGTRSVHFVDGAYNVRLANPDGMFGRGFYFAKHSSKSNQYVLPATGCRAHKDSSCYICHRKMLVCRVALGGTYETKFSLKQVPRDYNSVTGKTSPGGLRYPEFVVYEEDQVFPEYIIVYKIVK